MWMKLNRTYAYWLIYQGYIEEKKTFFINKTKRFLKIRLQKFASTYLIDCIISSLLDFQSEELLETRRTAKLL